MADWLDELEVTPGGPPVHYMGVRALPEGHLLVVDDARDAELDLKERLLAAHPDEIVAISPDPDHRVEEASQELLDVLVADLATNHGLEVTARTDLHPLDAAGRIVQEDLTVLRPGPDGYVLVGGTVCFPSGWYVRKKLGHNLAVIHEPIERYGDELERKVDRFFDALTVDRPMFRRNWFVYDNPDRFQPADPVLVGAATDARPLFLRSERECMFRLPRTDAVVFTIRTQQISLAELRGRPDVAAGLATYFREGPDVVHRLKGVADFLPEVYRQLDALVTGG